MKTKTVLTHIGPGSLRSQAEVPGTVTACTLCNLGESAEQPVGGRDSWSWCWALRHSPGGGSEDTIRRACARVRKWESLTVRTRSVPGDMVSDERNTVSVRRLGEGSPRSPDAAEQGSGC